MDSIELTVDEMLKQAVAAHNRGNVELAEQLYCTVLEAEPSHPDANHNLGVLAVSVDRAQLALPLFKTAIDANPSVEQFWLSYIGALVKEKHLETAREVLEQAKKSGLSEEKIDALETQLDQIAQSALLKISERGKSPASKEKQEEIFASKREKKKGESKNNREDKTINPLGPSKQQIGRLLELYQNGQHDEAERLARASTEQFPHDTFSWKILGAALRQKSRLPEALVACEKVVSLSPQDDQAHYNLGVALKELGKLEAAVASYERAIVLKPDSADANYSLGDTLQELGRLEEAEASYRQAIALKPDYAETHCNLGATLHELGKLDEAEASYKQAIALKPNYATAHSNLGITLQELGRLGEAEESYGQAIAIKPDHIDAFMNRWELLFKKRDFEAALIDADFCDTKLSRLHSLETLYALGRVKEIYQRIEMQSKVGDEDLGVAAFASFITNKEKKYTANNFCNEPLEFLHIANLSSYLQDANVFIKELVEELHDVKTIWEPSKRATRKGFQTAKNLNLFANPSVNVAHLKSIIVEELVLYYLKFQKKSCSFIRKWPAEKNLFGWHVILKHQGHQTAHIHPAGWLSGVIYLKVVSALGRDEGAIEFSLNGEHYSDDGSPKVVHQPAVGDIVFFPSSLHHRTIPFTTDSDRIIISFDLMPESSRHQFGRIV